MALKDKLMTLEDFKAVRDVDVASNSAKFTEINESLDDVKTDVANAFASGSTPFVDMLDDTDITNNGISYSLSGNTLSCDGTSTGTSQFVWFGTTSAKPPYWFVGGGKYIVSIDSTTELIDVRFQIKSTSDTSLHSLAIYSQSGKYILDVPEDITALRVVSMVSSGITLNNDTLTLNIERVINVDSDMSELRSGLGVLGIKNDLTWNNGSYKTDGTISTTVQYGNRYCNIIDATTFKKLTITPFIGRQVCLAFFDRTTGVFVSRSDYTTESVTIDNTYSVGINLATTYTDRTISTEDLLSLVEIYRSAPLSKWSGRKVAFIGDSITHGSYAPKPYHVVLNDMIGFGDVYVDGVAGSAYSVTATGNYTPISQRWQNIPTDRDLVVIFAGTNDWGHDAPIGTPADTTDVSMCGALYVVINGILTANPSARLVLITPLHRWGYTGGNYPNDTDNNGQGHPLADYVDAIKDMAQVYSIPVIDLFSDSGLNPRIPAISTTFFQDGLHPINAGHARLARQIASELEVLNFSGSGIKANLEAKYSQLKADLEDVEDKALKAFAVDSANGAVASFEDGADDIPLKSLVIDINPVQGGSGDPSPTNIRPITGWTGANVKRTGKNLANMFNDGKIPSISNGQLVTGSGLRSDYIPMDGDTQITFSGNSSLNIYCFFYDSGKNYISFSANMSPVSVTTPSNTAYVMLRTEPSATSLQLELGSTATTYEPYNCTTLSVDWTDEAGTVYGGTLDVTTGVLTVTHGIVDLGTFTFSYSDTYNRFLSTRYLEASKKPATNNDEIDGCVCSAYKITNSNKTADSTCDKNLGISMNGRIDIRNTDYTEVDAFSESLDGVMFVYPLATPVTYQLTAQEVKTLLGANNIYADTGDVSVTYRADTTLFVNRKIAEAISALS